MFLYSPIACNFRRLENIMTPFQHDFSDIISKKSHFSLALIHAGKIRALPLRPDLLYLCSASVVCAALCVAYFGQSNKAVPLTGNIQVIDPKPDIKTFESRIKILQDQLNEAQSKALVAKVTLESKVRELSARQSQVEAQQAIVTSLAKAAAPAIKADIHQAPPLLWDPATKDAGNSSLPEIANQNTTENWTAHSARRPTLLPDSETESEPKTVPGSQSLRDLIRTFTRADKHAPSPNLQTTAQASLDRTARKISESEAIQIATITALSDAAERTAAFDKRQLASVGLDFKKLSIPPDARAYGGPFVPLPVNPKANEFERAVFRAQDSLQAAYHLQQIMPYVPLNYPLGANAEVTSGFGARIDPFNGEMAMHTGLDFKLEYGAPIHPTAQGTVIAAEANGGYGNMIDIDHGNNIVTRYGHLATILVHPGDRVTPKSVIGRLGNTGRSTGPHLHYEVRINDEPVNPLRFLRTNLTATN